MTAYEIIAWCDRTFYTRFKIEADSPEQALEIGKKQVEHEPAEECDNSFNWDTFTVCDADEITVLDYQDEQANLREAAPKLLAACQMVVERWERGDLAEAARACAEAVARAEGRAARAASPETVSST